MEDQLKLIWSRQKSFNRNFVDFDNLSNEELQSFTKEYSLHLSSEVFSLLEKINWKINHRRDEIEINRRDVILEWIDIFKYWLSIGLLWDFSEKDFIKYFNEKSDLVEQRFLQEFGNYFEGKEVVICDIDGVLGDYPVSFFKFINEKEGRDIINTSNITSLDNYEYLKNIMSQDKIMHYKDLYRKSGAIRNEKVRKGSCEFLKYLKNKGYYIIVLTSRPFDRYSNLYLDTFTWLKENDLYFDMLLSDTKKRNKVNKIKSKCNIKAVIDDDPKILSSLKDDSFLKFLINKSYNENASLDSVIRVDSFSQIQEVL